MPAPKTMLQIAVIAILAVALAKKLPVVSNYL